MTATQTADVALKIEPSCEHCPYTLSRAVPRDEGKGARYLGSLIEMAPGPDGVPWYLCPRCWLDGLMAIAEPKKKSTSTGRVAEPSRQKNPAKPKRS